MEQFDRACEAAWAPLVRYLRASAGPDLDIEDLAARTLEIAWRRRATLTDAGGFTPWLLAIATNVAHNGRRGAVRLGRLRVRIANVREARDTHPSAHAELLRTEPCPATRALATLGRSDREVLVLHACEELGPADIAVVLAISPSIRPNSNQWDVEYATGAGASGIIAPKR